MPRRSFIQKPNLAYNMTGRCINREWFALPMPEVWEIMSTHLWALKYIYNFNIHVFVLMSNHFHLIARAPDGNLSAGMQYFMQSTGREIRLPQKRINQTYGQRFFRTELPSEQDYLQALKYAYRNPVLAKICQRVEDYPYSTLQNLLKCNVRDLPVEYDPHLYDENPDEHLAWLNESPEENDLYSVQKALSRTVFKLPRDLNTKKPNRLETQLM